MATINHSEKQLFTYFIYWSLSGPRFLMHLGKTWIYGDQRAYILKDTCRVWPKTAKIQDGR